MQVRRVVHYTYRFEDGAYAVFRVDREDNSRLVAKYFNPRTAADVVEKLTYLACEEV